MGKNHSTNKERSHHARRKHRVQVHAQTQQRVRIRRRKAAMALYWTGEAKDLREAMGMAWKLLRRTAALCG